MDPQQQPNPFDPSPKPPPTTGSLSRPTGWLAPLALLAAAVVLAAIGTSRDDQGLRVGAAVLAGIGVLTLVGPMLSSFGTRPAHWAIRLPPGSIPQGLALETDVEEQV